MGVGERIRQQREKCGISQRRLAKMLDVTNPTLSKMESGKAKIDADRLPRIAQLLGVSPCAFYEEQIAGGIEVPSTGQPLTVTLDPATVDAINAAIREGVQRELEERQESVLRKIREALREEFDELETETVKAIESSGYRPDRVDMLAKGLTHARYGDLANRTAEENDPITDLNDEKQG